MILLFLGNDAWFNDLDAVFKQFHSFVELKDMDGCQWFSLAKAYGNEYGNIHKSYSFKKQPRLLDIGNWEIRQKIERRIQKYEPENVFFCHPDEQYSGGMSNKKYHEALKRIFGKCFDGTIISEEHLTGSKKHPDTDDLEGATEMVLWGHFADILEPIS